MRPGGRFHGGSFVGGRFVDSVISGPYIALAQGVSLPALLAVEAGDILAAPVPPEAFDPASFRVVGDQTDDIKSILLEWSLNGAAWQSRYTIPIFFDGDPLNLFAAAFTRASAGYYLGEDGSYATYAVDQVRTGDQGLLIEPAATNLVTRSVPGGADYSNTALTGVGSATRFGFDMLTVSGATYNKYAIYDQSNSGWIVSPTTYVIPASNRVEVAFTAPAGCTEVRFYVLRDSTDTRFSYIVCTVTPGESYTASFIVDESGGSYYFGASQVEVGVAATSPIITTGAALTRPADALTLPFPETTADITVTFDDASTQLLSGVSIGAGGWVVPTNLNRPLIRKIEGVTSV